MIPGTAEAESGRETAPPRAGAIPLRYAGCALALLTGINILNYIDRYIVSAILPDLKDALSLTDARAGMIGSAFMAVYLATSPVFGSLGDRWPRRWIVAGAVALWSVATALGGMVRSFAQLLVCRGLVGVGEAGYGPVSPTLIADYFPAARRGSMLSIFYAAIPVGAALGYILGGAIAKHLGWRYVFYVVGLPGIALAVAACFLREPPRGGPGGAPGAAPHTGGYRFLLGIPSYWLNTAAMTAMTFAMGGVAFWLPDFLIEVRHLDKAGAPQTCGLVLVTAGPLGTALGGWLADRLRARLFSAPLVVSAVGLIAAAPVAAVAILSPNPHVYWPAFFLAELLLFLNTGPLNAVIVEVTPALGRARAFAVNIFIIHLLGDVLSPTLLGTLSDWWGKVPAFMIMPVVIALAGTLCLATIRTYARDVAAAAADGPDPAPPAFRAAPPPTVPPAAATPPTAPTAGEA